MSRHWNEDETEWSSLFVQKKDLNVLLKNPVMTISWLNYFAVFLHKKAKYNLLYFHQSRGFIIDS